MESKKLRDLFRFRRNIGRPPVEREAPVKRGFLEDWGLPSYARKGKGVGRGQKSEPSEEPSSELGCGTERKKESKRTRGKWPLFRLWR